MRESAAVVSRQHQPEFCCRELNPSARFSLLLWNQHQKESLEQPIPFATLLPYTIVQVSAVPLSLSLLLIDSYMISQKNAIIPVIHIHFILRHTGQLQNGGIVIDRQV